MVHTLSYAFRAFALAIILSLAGTSIAYAHVPPPHRDGKVHGSKTTLGPRGRDPILLCPNGKKLYAVSEGTKVVFCSQRDGLGIVEDNLVLSCSQLGALWISAGGSYSLERIMEGIAIAESDGNQYALGDMGTSYGLWQINNGSGVIPTFDEYGNARDAVTIERKNGLNAWTTYRNGAFRNWCGN